MVKNKGIPLYFNIMFSRILTQTLVMDTRTINITGNSKTLRVEGEVETPIEMLQIYINLSL